MTSFDLSAGSTSAKKVRCGFQLERERERIVCLRLVPAGLYKFPPTPWGSLVTVLHTMNRCTSGGIIFPNRLSFCLTILSSIQQVALNVDQNGHLQ